jgi:uncharacterized RDD family membrane protein YckC
MRLSPWMAKKWMKAPDESGPRAPPAGFWSRLGAGLFDLALTAVVVMAGARLLLVWDWYVPVELTVLLFWPAYLTIAQAWKQRTIGKWLGGLAVETSNGERCGIVRLLLRETAGKAASAFPFGAGLLWSGFSRDKLAWHDWIFRTRVVQRTAWPGRAGRWSVGVGAAVAVGAFFGFPGLVTIGLDVREMRAREPIRYVFEDRDPANLTEAATLDESSLNEMADWVRERGMDPVEYAVAKAKRHPVLVFGEVHEKKEALELLHAMIPELYLRAGVTRIALEVCLAEDNEKLRRLVTGESFDRELALEIARRQPWGIWGFAEYWDVFEIVWQLNRTIPEGDPKVWVIGLDRRMDMQSVGMVGLEDNPAKHCPWWEKLRVARLPRVLPQVLARDARMAREIEREILEKGERGIVWVGQQHAWASPQTVSAGGIRATRMGTLLRGRHEDQVFFIWLHAFDIPVSWVSSAYRGSAPAFGSAIEEIMRRSKLERAGFDTAGSALGGLRDGSSWNFHYEARLGFADLADGFVYLGPWSGYTQCTWQSGYITPRMFASAKPFHQAFGRKAGRPLPDAAAVNRLFEEP